MATFNRVSQPDILFYFVIRAWPAQSSGECPADSAPAHAPAPAHARTCNRDGPGDPFIEYYPRRL